MRTITATELRSNIDKLLDEILATGVPLAINRGGRKLTIAPTEPVDKFANMTFRPDVINGDPAELIHIAWEHNVALP